MNHESEKNERDIYIYIYMNTVFTYACPHNKKVVNWMVLGKECLKLIFCILYVLNCKEERENRTEVNYLFFPTFCTQVSALHVSDLIGPSSGASLQKLYMQTVVRGNTRTTRHVQLVQRCRKNILQKMIHGPYNVKLQKSKLFKSIIHIALVQVDIL